MLRPYIGIAAKQNVRVSDVRFPEHPAPAVAGALGFGARRSFEIVHELPQDAPLHQPRRARRDTFVVDGPRRRATGREGIVEDRQALIEQSLTDFADRKSTR